VDGSGEISLDIDIPNETAIDHLWIYRNRENGEAIHWLPEKYLAVSPNTTETVLIKSLFPGLNKIVARVSDSNGRQEQNENYFELFLDANLDQLTELYPNPPSWISAEMNSSYNTVITTKCDSSVATIKFYASTDLTTLYDSVNSTITVSDYTINQTKTITLASGEWFIGARSANDDGVIETNTDVVCKIHIDTNAATAVSDLAVTLV